MCGFGCFSDRVIWRVTTECMVWVTMVLAWCFGGIPMELRVLVFQWAPWFTKHMNSCVCDKRLCGIGKYYMLGSFGCLYLLEVLGVFSGLD